MKESKFDKILRENAKHYKVDVLSEAEGADMGSGVQAGGAGADVAMDQMPPEQSGVEPAEGAGTEEKIYNKPWDKLAKIMVYLLDITRDDIDEELGRKLENIDLQNIKDEQQGQEIIKLFEDIWEAGAQNTVPEYDVADPSGF